MGRILAGTPRRTGAGGLRRAAVGLLAALAAGAWLALSPARAGAQGFGINEHGTCTMSRGGAAVAQPCEDGSAIFYNPAGLAGMEGVTVSAGGTLISAVGDFTSASTLESWELQNDPIPVPHGYVAAGLDDRLAVGLGVFVPYGLETRWPSSRESGFPGRFVGYHSKLQSIYVQPTVSYRPTEWLSVGAGLDVVVGTVELNQRLDLSQRLAVPSQGITFGELGIPFHTGFADASLDADPSTALGANFGVQLRPDDRITFGARYMTQATVDYEGQATFSQVPTGLTIPVDLTLPSGQTIPAGTPVDALVAPQFQSGGTLATQGVTTRITMPGQLVAGVAVEPSERVLFEVDWQWVDWSDFDRIVIDLERAPDTERIQDYGDTHAIRLGAEYEATDRVDVRGGYIYHGSAAPDETVTPLLPEAARNEVSAGLGVRLSDLISVDASYHYIAQDDRRGRVRDPLRGQEPTPALNSGLYTFAGHLFGTTVTLHF